MKGKLNYLFLFLIVSFSFISSVFADDNTLSSLVVNGGSSINFKSDQYNYLTVLDGPNFSLDMMASTSSYQDDIVVKNKDNGEVLNPKGITFSANEEGYMMLSIRINDDDKTEYTLVVKYTKEGLDNTLSSLKINGKNVKLVNGETNYTVTIGSDVSNFDVEAILTDSNNFKFGNNGNVKQTKTNFNISDVAYVIIAVEPKSTDMGVASLTYNITVQKEGMVGGDSLNPETGDGTMWIMAIILVSSLIGSIVLYKNNMESYNSN